MLQTSTNIYQEPGLIKAAVEMRGKFWEPVPVEEFFDKFLDVKPPPLPDVHHEEFAAVAALETEMDMHGPLIAVLEPFCQGITLKNTSAVVDPNSGVFMNQCVKPDISIYDDQDVPRAGECITQANSMTGFGVLKNSDAAEPFALDHPLYSIGADNPFEHDTVHARGTRGQLTLCANAIQAMQFRTHSFSFFINKTKCRLIHWSRSCAIVTSEFDYTKTEWFPKFFWYLSHAPKGIRGIDTTFARATDGNDAQEARETLGLKSEHAYPLYRVSVQDYRTETTCYIVTKPLTNSHAFPVGRGTRCFEAYNCQTGAIVLLKDTWRISTYEPEGVIYDELHKAGVRNIAAFITTGDVGHVCGKTEEFSAASQDKCPAVHIHYRLVLGTIGTPLKLFLSSWQMVSAVKGALIAHYDATTKAKILHRDISAGNIIIVKEEGEETGILIDWEMCKHIGEPPAPAISRELTGTWQFISARLLMDKDYQHSIGDDLESFVHVLAWAAIKYAQNTLDTQHRAQLLQKFDSSRAVDAGREKQNSFQRDVAAIREIGLIQKPFSAVLSEIYVAFGLRYDSPRSFSMTEEAVQVEVAKLETHEWLLDLLETALENDEWKASGDGRVGRCLPFSGLNSKKVAKRKTSMPLEYGEKLEKKRAKRNGDTEL